MTDTQPKKRRTSFWRELPVLIIVAIVVAIVVRAFVLQTFYIPSESMEHTLEIHDRVLVNKLVYNFRSPRRGEIIVFKAPRPWRSDPREEDFIKRVIGVSGDHLVCCDQGRLVINGYPLNEPYLFKDGNGTVDKASEDRFDVRVPKDRLWVMGDHRSYSGDSRQRFVETRSLEMSTIKEDDVIGRAFVVFWPLSRARWLSVPDTFDMVPDP